MKKLHTFLLLAITTLTLAACSQAPVSNTNQQAPMPNSAAPQESNSGPGVEARLAECDAMGSTDKIIPATCYIGVAKDFKDRGICAKILNKTYEDSCISQMAKLGM